MTWTLTWKSGVAAVAACVVGMAAIGCGLEEVNVPPTLIGPSELGTSVELRATPNVVNADGGSQSVVQALVRDQNGKPLAGQKLYFALLDGDGAIIAGGILVGGLQTGIALVTGSNGVAQIVYQAGTSPGRITIGVMPYSFDANSQFLRTVQIDQL